MGEELFIQTYAHAQDHVENTDILEDETTLGQQVFVHNFSEAGLFPQLSERQSLSDNDVSISIIKDPDLDVAYETTASITMVESGAGYNNSLGAYTVTADGTIKAVEMAYNNVKVPLKYQKTIDKYDKKIDQLQAKIEKQPEKADRYQRDIDKYEAKKANVMAKFDSSFEYSVKGEDNVEIGFFIIANGDRINKGYKNMDLDTGELRFIYDLGGENERLAKTSDSAADISLVYVNGDVTQILKGHIYHSTDSDASTAINPDDAVHAVAGLVDPDDDTVLRVGFEDLKNLGDADFNDVVFDVTIDTQTVEFTEFHAGAGDDKVIGTENADIIFGGQGMDIIYGGGGDDTLLRGDLGDDVIYGEGGNDLIHGGRGDDKLYGGLGADIIYGQEDNDTIYGGEGDDELHGHDGDDVIFGESGHDFIDGGLGDDVLSGGAGDDRLYGDDGHDLLSGGAGNDILNGEAGIDTVTYSDASSGVNVQLASSTAQDGEGGTDTLIAIENVAGSQFDDAISGSRFDNILNGLQGDDTIQGGSGNDTIYGDEGADILYGGADNDLLIGGAGNDILHGNAGSDTFAFTDLSHGVDLITDFTRGGAEGDILNISDIISGLDIDADSIDNSVVMGVVNSDRANLWINDGESWNQVAVIRGADFTGVKASELIAEGTLTIDQNIL